MIDSFRTDHESRQTRDSVAPRLIILSISTRHGEQIPAWLCAFFQGYTSADLAALLSTSQGVWATPRSHRAAYRDFVDHSPVAGQLIRSGEKQRRARATFGPWSRWFGQGFTTPRHSPGPVNHSRHIDPILVNTIHDPIWALKQLPQGIFFVFWNHCSRLREIRQLPRAGEDSLNHAAAVLRRMPGNVRFDCPQIG
jgi:hypothetical protein